MTSTELRMIMVDTAFRAREAEGRPDPRRSSSAPALWAKGLPNQLVNSVPGMRLVACPVGARARASSASEYVGLPAGGLVSELGTFEDTAGPGAAVATAPRAARRSEHIDVLVDVTGSVEFGATVALEAFANGKHVVLLNAELDATVGPILQTHAERARRDAVCLRRGRARIAR